MTDQATLAANTLSGRYTELPKTLELIELGVTPELIPTFHALTDYVNNQTGKCYPQMKTIAAKLRISVRTVQRHLHQLADLGLIDFVRRLRTDEGKYRGYVYRIAHVEKIAERRKAKKQEAQERERQRALERGRKRRKRLFNQKSSTGHGRPVPVDTGTNTDQENPPNPPQVASRRATSGSSVKNHPRREGRTSIKRRLRTSRKATSGSSSRASRSEQAEI